MQLKPGTLLQGGKYEIVSTLGQGGFGITYEAVQTNLGRKVALKEFFMKGNCEREENTSLVIVPTQSNRSLVEKFRAKFLREARLIASMENNHIVRVHDVFEENGTAYYVMENLPGGSLADKVKREGPLPEALAEKYIRQVASALNYIHSRNTVHLDVKPSNILLNLDGEAVLIDFGISKHYDKAGEQTSSTPVGYSPGYAPLEQMKAVDVKSFTPATDIYSLGATMYYLVTGTVPPDTPSLLEDGLARPEGLSDNVWNAIERAMQPVRKNRCQSIQEFLGLLDAKEEKEAEDEVDTSADAQAAIPAEDEPKNEETVVEEEVAEASTACQESDQKPAPVPEQDPEVSKKATSKPWWLAVASVIAVALVVFFVTKPSSSPSGNINGHEYVDLGLSVKWATCNLGATKPEEYGDYYAWGETATKTDYSWNTYKWCKGDYNKLTKYCPSGDSSYWAGYGSPDGKTSLDLADDVAHIKFVGKWRLPTDAEWTELRERCEWTWTTLNGVKGRKVTGPNGNSIFLPAAGYRYDTNLYFVGSYGYYWSSSLNTGFPYYAWRVYFNSGYVYRGSYYRYYGQSVRPVTE